MWTKTSMQITTKRVRSPYQSTCFLECVFCGVCTCE